MRYTSPCMPIDYYPLINRIVSTLKIRDTLEKQVPKEEHFFERPFITVAREPGSGGAPIARRLATRLSFTLHDEAIVDELAKSTKKHKAAIKEIDEKGRTYVDNIIHSVLNPEYVEESRYARALSRVVLNFAHQGNCVILGRGANFITPFARGLHVNIVAPYDVRVQRAMQYEGFDEETAQEVIAQVEKERDDFVKTYFKKDLNSRNAYDITLNTTHYSINEATDVIMMAFRRKFPAFQRLRATLLP
ncbi:MAG: putative cytosolic protein [Candidatus Pacebacteria bacterium GW2011_GWB1_47_8]|nr:MAG: putative cytosolic protein [Candidatus Pacebacteria bacterium GW2011_GWA1_46_10]KKU84473.1 MAG: putative cytosolic protein [Candidatus Pacebacteria bacterium GW2011_GWB1_47_8]